MDRQAVIEYFGKLAPQWDINTIRNDDVINTILDNAGVTEGKDVLDVACGTGVLIPDYLARKAAMVTGIDLTPEMAEIAAGKFPCGNVRIICGDVETEEFGGQFDCIVVYNAFPHFPNPERLIARLSSLLRPGGTLTVAHGMSRARINGMHSGDSSRISNGLISAEQLSGIFSRYLSVTHVISDDRMYQVAGKKE